MSNSKASHFVWLNPGEKLYIVTDAVGHNHDYTHVVEIVLPTNNDPTFPMFKKLEPATSGHMKFEQNHIANITAGEAETVLVGVAHRGIKSYRRRDQQEGGSNHSGDGGTRGFVVVEKLCVMQFE